MYSAIVFSVPVRSKDRRRGISHVLSEEVAAVQDETRSKQMMNPLDGSSYLGRMNTTEHTLRRNTHSLSSANRSECALLGTGVTCHSHIPLSSFGMWLA